MEITKRSVVSVADATARLNVLANRYGIESPQYDEFESGHMSEFDALKWTSLCAQRAALMQREIKGTPSATYMHSDFCNFGRMQTSVNPENIEDNLALAA